MSDGGKTNVVFVVSDGFGVEEGFVKSNHLLLRLVHHLCTSSVAVVHGHVWWCVVLMDCVWL